MAFQTRSLIDSLGVGEDGVSPLYPENFSADIGAAFDADMGIADGKIAGQAADIARLTEENNALKAHNYDLLMASSAAVGPVDANVDDDAESDDDGDDDDYEDEDSDGPKGMDRIFSKKDED